MLQRIAKDGNCFYRAISHQLALHQIFIDHIKIRRKTCDLIKENSETYSNFLEDLTIGEYMEKQSSDGFWADYVAIYASSRALNFSLLVFDKTGLRNEFNLSGNPKLKIFYKNENHFESIIDLDICVENKIIEFQISTPLNEKFLSTYIKKRYFLSYCKKYSK